MTKILILDDMALLRELIAAALKAKGYAVTGAGSAREAIAAARADRPDLVLLEPASGGNAGDGMTFLRALRADRKLASVPVLILAAAADRRHVVDAVRLGVTQYVLKSRSSIKDLFERVAKACGPPPSAAANSSPSVAAVPPAPGATPAGVSASPRQLLTREQCLERVEKALQAKTLSGVVAQVIANAASPRTDLSQLADLIARDVVLSARVLHAANSPAYASARGPIANIPQAVRQIGCSTVRNIAAAVGVFDVMPATAPDGFNPIRCWQHSFAVARLCEQLVNPQTPELAGTAYLVGLCHDLGAILFRTHFGAEYGHVLEAQRTTGWPLRRLERDMLGITQEELSMAILRSLKLPQEIREPIESMHAGDGAEPRDQLGRVLRIAELYANGMLLAAGGSAPIAPIGRADCRRAVGADSPPPPEAGALRSEIMTLTLMLARLDADDERALTQLPHAQRDARFWLVREAGLSAFDPLAAALETLGHVTVSDALPAPGEAADCAGIVVVARSPRAVGLDAAAITTAAGPLPVLWLVAQTDKEAPPSTPAPLPSPVTTVRPQAWPISLDELAAFVGSCADTAAAAAAQVSAQAA